MSKEILDNVSTLEMAIRYLKGNPYIQDDSYSMEALYHIEQALTPPTVEEVCALIEKDIKGKVTYSHGEFYIDNEKVDNILFGVFRAKTLIAVGKFYEEIEK